MMKIQRVPGRARVFSPQKQVYINQRSTEPCFASDDPNQWFSESELKDLALGPMHYEPSPDLTSTTDASSPDPQSQKTHDTHEPTIKPATTQIDTSAATSV